ncbi:threonine-tRNA ligase (TARS1) [Vairimorpha necatrix]|uniref:Probable threonine--tRNA ligase, cytoplasmic n=1 Tax=Vairimorpha necatrix TaxID=6039 RepID=A0AAX4JB37_9MICR
MSEPCEMSKSNLNLSQSNLQSLNSGISDIIKISYNNKIYEIKSNFSAYDFLNKFTDLSDILMCKINGDFSDLSTILQNDNKLSFCTFEECKDIFWHSSAHVLGMALVNLFPNCKLIKGPPLENGFFYDIDIEKTISQEDYKNIENEMYKIIKKDYKFQKIYYKKSDLLEMYKNNPYKLHFVNTKVSEGSTVYKNGDFFDLCKGPHIFSTGKIKAVKILKNSSVHHNENQVQRIYGITFPNKELLKNFIKLNEEAKNKDHRKIGKELDLFFFHEYSPGSCFFLPNGTFIYNKLVDLMKSEYKKRGFKEVISPNIFSIDLWKESGHYENYKDNIFILENENMAMKPMNCPGHCLMFKNFDHSFRDLPIRYADFGVLHRNELSGALTGLTRVRRFQQDDAHIFCTKEQVKNEIIGCLDFLKFIYEIFNFKFSLFLSTRPEKFIGEIEEWNQAEKSLEEAIKACNFDYQINEGDGAFYGPKIDIILQDALGRKIQCGTIQLDFQLPQRFKLKYRSDEGNQKTPVIIHRAILGSVERFIAILLESYGKNLPFWINPRQVGIVSLADEKYTEKVREKFKDFKCEILRDNNTLNKNLRILIKKGYSFVCVIGKKEAENESINVRINNKQKEYKLEKFIENLSQLNLREINEEEFNEEQICEEVNEKLNI